MKQLSLFPDPPDPRPPETITWNLWHGCSRVSAGCSRCYMFRRDEAVGKDPTNVRKTQSFDLPVRVLRAEDTAKLTEDLSSCNGGIGAYWFTDGVFFVEFKTHVLAFLSGTFD